MGPGPLDRNAEVPYFSLEFDRAARARPPALRDGQFYLQAAQVLAEAIHAFGERHLERAPSQGPSLCPRRVFERTRRVLLTYMEVASPSLTQPARGYAPSGAERPLGAYAILAVSFQGLVALAAVLLRRSGKSLPERYAPSDVVLVGAATHKFARLIAKDKVTSFLRAPFVEYQGEGGPSELEERPRGSGLRYATGELLGCPYCLGLWVSSGFGVGLVAAPRLTRLVALVLTSLGRSDSFRWPTRRRKKDRLRASGDVRRRR